MMETETKPKPVVIQTRVEYDRIFPVYEPSAWLERKKNTESP